MLEGLAIGMALGFLAGFVVHYHYYGKRIRLLALFLNDHMRLLHDLEKRHLPEGWLDTYRAQFKDKFGQLTRLFPTTSVSSGSTVDSSD